MNLDHLGEHHRNPFIHYNLVSKLVPTAFIYTGTHSKVRLDLHSVVLKYFVLQWERSHGFNRHFVRSVMLNSVNSLGILN